MPPAPAVPTEAADRRIACSLAKGGGLLYKAFSHYNCNGGGAIIREYVVATSSVRSLSPLRFDFPNLFLNTTGELRSLLTRRPRVAETRALEAPATELRSASSLFLLVAAAKAGIQRASQPSSGLMGSTVC